VWVAVVRGECGSQWWEESVGRSGERRVY